MLSYLSGQWSRVLGHSRMPVDEMLLGSRVMTAKDAHTSPTVKALIVQTSRTFEFDWHGAYGGYAGRAVTVGSEMGEPIHKIANRATLLWRDLDITILSLKDPV